MCVCVVLCMCVCVWGGGGGRGGHSHNIILYPGLCGEGEYIEVRMVQGGYHTQLVLNNHKINNNAVAVMF